EAESEEGAGSRTKLSFKELVSQASLFFLAGNDTSSFVLAVLAYLLARHQDVQDRLIAEIDRELGPDATSPGTLAPTPTSSSSPSTAAAAATTASSPLSSSPLGKTAPPPLNYDSIQKLHLMKACVLEALRLHPVISVFTRQALESTEIAGYPIPAGAGVYVPVKSVCSDPDLYPEPELFKPERFLKGHLESLMTDSASGGVGLGSAMFLPFGVGPRSCIGMRLGMYQVMMVMAAVLKKVRFVSAPGEINIPRAVMFGIPPFSEPLMVEVEAREQL
ncbi:hypothetical protein EGW08_012946, partial [Elysia chlorotica]